MFAISIVKFVAQQRCLCKCTCAVILNRHHHLPEVETHRSVPLPFRSDQPFGRYSRKRLKMRMCQSACAKCQRSIPYIHHDLPEIETHRSVPLPIAIGPAVRTLFAKKKLKIRIVLIAIGMCQVPPIACQQAQSYSRCRSTSIIVSPNPIGPAVQTVFAKGLKINCANCHVPSATNRFSMVTVIFPRSKHIDQCLSLLRSDQPFGHYSRKG